MTKNDKRILLLIKWYLKHYGSFCYYSGLPLGHNKRENIGIMRDALRLFIYDGTTYERTLKPL